MITSFQRSAAFYSAELDFICLIVFLLSLFCFTPPPPAVAPQPSARARAHAEPSGWSEDGGSLARNRGGFWGEGKKLREMKAEEELKVIECWRILLAAAALFTAIYFFDSLPLGCGP